MLAARNKERAIFRQNNNRGLNVLLREGEVIPTRQVSEYLVNHRARRSAAIPFRPMKRVACAEVAVNCETLPAPPASCLSKKTKQGVEPFAEDDFKYWPLELAVSVPVPGRPRD